MKELIIDLIRHGATPGNQQKRYIGAATDEYLSPEGICFLNTRRYPRRDLLFVSPMRRCVETAELLYARQQQIFMDALKECDFGRFENRNAEEMAGDPEFQAWVDSGAALPFPGGESREAFAARNIRGFVQAVDEMIKQEASSASFVIHGGTIMNILAGFGVPKQEFYAWHVDNGCGYRAHVKPDAWITGKKELYGLLRL